MPIVVGDAAETSLAPVLRLKSYEVAIEASMEKIMYNMFKPKAKKFPLPLFFRFGFQLKSGIVERLSL